MGIVGGMGFSKTHEQVAAQLRAQDRRKWKVAQRRNKKDRKGKSRAGKPGRFVAIDYKPGMKREFYATKEWRSLRWEVLSKSDGRCAMCGHTAQTSGRSMHVDHIEARSKRPDLELHIANLQVLCEDCNLGKGAQYWRARSFAAAQASPATPGINPAPRYRLIKGGQR